MVLQLQSMIKRLIVSSLRDHRFNKVFTTTPNCLAIVRPDSHSCQAPCRRGIGVNQDNSVLSLLLTKWYSSREHQLTPLAWWNLEETSVKTLSHDTHGWHEWALWWLAPEWISGLKGYWKRWASWPCLFLLAHCRCIRDRVKIELQFMEAGVVNWAKQKVAPVI